MRPPPFPRYTNGDVYTGELLGLARHGAGECKYGGGASVYQGQWEADRHEGQGRLSSRRGEEFDGEWLAGEPHGQVLTTYYLPLAPALPSRNSSHACTLAPALDPNASLGPNRNPNLTLALALTRGGGAAQSVWRRRGPSRGGCCTARGDGATRWAARGAGSSYVACCR